MQQIIARLISTRSISEATLDACDGLVDGIGFIVTSLSAEAVSMPSPVRSAHLEISGGVDASPPLASMQSPAQLPGRTVHSVVIPIYNSVATLDRLHGRLVTAMEALNAPFEIVFVDDCSTDGSWAALSRIAHIDGRVVAMQLRTNSGQGRATLVGLKQASGDILITLDDDLQHPPEEIPRLLAVLEASDGLDAVFGIPINRRGPEWRRASSWVVNLGLSLALNKPLGLRNTAFRAIRRPLAVRLAAVAHREPMIATLLYQVTSRIGVARVMHSDSALAASRYSLAKLIRLFFDTIGCLSDRHRFRAAFMAGGTGMSLLVIAMAIRLFGGFAGLFIALLPLVLGLVLLGLGVAAAAPQFSARHFRHRGVSTPSVVRIIRDQQVVDGALLTLESGGS